MMLASRPPILFGFALHRRCVGVLHFEPIGRAPRAIGRLLPLRHDAFESHLAGVGEDGRAVAFQMLVEAQAKASFGQHTSKCGLRTSIGSRRLSSPFSSIRSKAYRNVLSSWRR